MSQSNDNKALDWDTFRFPPRPAAPAPPPQGDINEQGDAGDEDEGRGEGELALHPPPSQWEYCSKNQTLKNVGLGKQIRLAEVDQVSKIVRLLAILEDRPEYHVDSLVNALEEACQDCYGQDLVQVLADHRWGLTLSWKSLNYIQMNQEDTEDKNHLRSRHAMG